ncbi:hypothetical protein CAAN1_04S00848 [[Candida] anglica]|uniref:Uncharacterized protein n=1 Tax=[Candida] anglica TaxID=148631 RepID=A0ABP0E9Q2_9ASCO
MEQENKDWIKLSEVLVSKPDDFETWQKLVEAAEAGSTHDGISKSSTSTELNILRITYENLLDKWPLLHQYWLNYAEWEFKLGHTENCRQVYQRALVQLPRSIECWLAYTKFIILTSCDESETLKVLESARYHIGNHFYSHEFYDEYLTYLESRSKYDENMRKRFYILLRIIIELPLYHYGKYFKTFIQLVDKLDHQTAKYLIPDREMSRYNLKDLKQTSSKLKKLFTDVYISTQFKVYGLYTYEKRITRSYFHVNYLSKDQLNVWQEYLDFVELKYPELVELTYERCIVSTALYKDFWIRYSDYYIRKSQSIESAKQILLKAISITPMTNIELKLKLIDLETFQGNHVKARDIVLMNLRLFPECLPLIVKLLNLERMLHPNDDEYVLGLFETLISETKLVYLYKELVNYKFEDHAMSKFFRKFENNEDSWIFWTSYLECMISSNGNKEVTQLKKIYEQGLTKISSSTDREKFSTSWGSLLQISP